MAPRSRIHDGWAPRNLARSQSPSSFLVEAAILQATGAAPGAGAISSALNLLAARAQFDAPRRFRTTGGSSARPSGRSDQLKGSPPSAGAGSKRSKVIARANTASVSTTNGGFASSGPQVRLVRSLSKSQTTIEGGSYGPARQFISANSPKNSKTSVSVRPSWHARSKCQ